jgi:hypothetical protein
MARVFGRVIGREALLASVGDMAQVCGIQSFAFDDGPGRGVRALEFRTGGGLRFVVLPDRAMDLYSAEYRGTPLNWLSGTGPVSPGMYCSRGWEWLRSFFGGLLTTCGLSNVGDPCDDRGTYLESEHFGGHGRISNLSARGVGYRGAWEGERYVLSAEGETVETAGQGEKLRLFRSIRAEMGKNAIAIADQVTNEAFTPAPFMFLYHINVGYPLLDRGTRVLASCTARSGMDPVSQAQLPHIGDIGAPAAGAPELVFMLEMKPDKDGYCHVVVSNPGLDAGRGLGLFLRYRRADFPYFHIWKRLGCREYVLGLEPGICTVQGRVRQRERGDLRLLAPQETATFAMEIGVLDSSVEVDRFAGEHGLDPL